MITRQQFETQSTPSQGLSPGLYSNTSLSNTKDEKPKVKGPYNRAVSLIVDKTTTQLIPLYKKQRSLGILPESNADRIERILNDTKRKIYFPSKFKNRPHTGSLNEEIFSDMGNEKNTESSLHILGEKGGIF